MRIAQVAPLYESVPPRLYGGTERVVSWLTEQLVSLGHDVTLFASGDSVTSRTIGSRMQTALRLDPDCIDPLAHHVLMVERVFNQADEFDLIHFHIDYLQFSLSRRVACSMCNDAAWQARLARSGSALQGILGGSAGIDLRCPAPSSTLGQLDGNCPPWSARQFALAERRPAETIWHFSDEYHRKKG